MAGTKISALPAVGSALLTDYFAVVQSGVTSKETLSQVVSLFNSSLNYLPLSGGTLTGDVVINNTKGIKTNIGAGNTILIQAYDVDGAVYVPFITLTANNSPTMDINTSSTLGGAYIYRAGGTDIPLADGGTNASLTASNGGIFYSTATAAAILAGTATAGKMLRSGSTAAPTWSSSTFADTYAASSILYSNGADAVSALATANNGVLITNGSGVPSISSTLPASLNVPQPNIVGTTTNNNATALSVGEFITSNVPFASGVALTDGVIADITSISLTAGDWDVWGNVTFNPSGIGTIFQGWSSETSATIPDVSTVSTFNVSALGVVGGTVPVRRESLAGTTTIYLSARAAFSTGTMDASGTISARRRR